MPTPDTAPMKNVTVATARTGVNSAWLALIGYLLVRYTKINIQWDDPLVIAALPVANVAWYRISVLLARIDIFAWLLFGIDRTPKYVPVAPPNGDDEGSVDLRDILFTLLIIFLIVMIVRWI